MSLTDNLGELFENEIFDDAMEAQEDAALDFEFALESAVEAVEPTLKLSAKDIRAIFDDNNPDNVAADIDLGDEEGEGVEKDALAAAVKERKASSDSLQSAMEALTLAMEVGIPENDDPEDDANYKEELKASESDEDDDSEGEGEDDDLDLSLESILRDLC